MTDQLPPVRRLVSGDNAAGRSSIVDDGPALASSRTVPGRPGYRVTNLWTTLATPAPIGQPDRAVVVAIGDRHDRTATHQPKSDRPRHSPGAQDQDLFFKEGTGCFFAGAAPHRSFERIHGCAIICVVADPLTIVLKDDRVAAPRPIDRTFFLLQEGHDRFLVGNREVATRKAQRRKRPQRGAKAFGPNGERNISAREFILGEPEIVNFGGARMHDRPPHDAGNQKSFRMRHAKFHVD